MSETRESWTLNAQAFRAALAVSDVTRSLDPSRPFLGGWLLSTSATDVRGGTLLRAVTTNSYALTVADVSYTTSTVDPVGMSVLFATSGTKPVKLSELAPVSKPADARNASALVGVGLDWDTDRARLASADQSMDGILIRPESAFPKYEGLVPKEIACHEGGGAFNPAYLDAPTRAMAGLRKALGLKRSDTDSVPVRVLNIDPLTPARLSWTYVHRVGHADPLTITVQHVIMPVRVQ